MVGKADVSIDYNPLPLTDFEDITSKPKTRARRSLDQYNHPTSPGEVKVFKEANPVDSKVNTWEINLRIEGKDKPTKSDIVLVIVHQLL